MGHSLSKIDPLSCVIVSLDKKPKAKNRKNTGK